MQLFVLAGPHTPSLRHRARALLRETESDAARTLILGYGRDAGAGWISEGIEGPRVGDPEAFFEHELSQLPNAPRLLHAPDRLFLLREVLGGLRPKLGPLRALSGASELLRQLDLLIADGRRAGATHLPPGGDWGEDLALVWNAYNARLRELGACDAEAAPQCWAQLRNDYAAPNGGEPFATVVFDNVLAPSPALWEGLTGLAKTAQNAIVLLAAPGIATAPTSFGAWPAALGGTLAARPAGLWSEWAKVQGIRVKAQWVPHPSGAGALNEARALLGFDVLQPSPKKKPASRAPAPQPAAPQAVAPQPSLFDTGAGGEAGETAGAEPMVAVQTPSVRLTLSLAPTPRDELRRIAGDIRRRVNEGASLSDFALLLPDPARYVGVLDAAFTEHDLPLFVRRARPHSSYPIVRRALGLLHLATAPKFRLDIVCDTFADDLFRLVEDGASEGVEDEGGESEDEGNALDTRAFGKLCRAARREELDDDILEALAQSEPETVSPMLALRLFGRQLTAPRALPKVPALVTELMEECAGHLRESTDELDGEAWLQVEAVLRALERVVTRHQDFGGKGRPAWLQWLATELENTDEPLESGTPAEGIEVGGLLPLESGIGGARVVYIGGLLEGEWPDTGLPGTLYARHARILEPLRAHRPDPSLRARHGLALALGEASEVHLSYPQSRGSRETSHSPLIEDALVLWPDLPALAPPAHPVSRLEWLRQTGDTAAHAETLALNEATLPFPSPVPSLRALDAMRRDRLDTERIGVYGGSLPEDPATHNLLRTLLPVADNVEQWKVASLGQYAACPWKFWGRELLKLKPAVLSRDDLPRSARGRLLHQIIEAFEIQWVRAVTPERFHEAWKALRDVAREHIERLPLRRILRDAEACSLLGRDWGGEGETASGILGKWLRSRCAPDDLPPAGFAAKTEKPKKGGFGDWARPTVPLGGSGHVLSEYFGGGAAWDWMVALDDEGNRWATGRVDRLEIAPRGEMLVLLDEQDKGAWLLPGFAEAAVGLDFGLSLALLAARDKVQEALDQEPVTEMPDAPKLAAANFSLPEAKAGGRFGERGTLGRNPRRGSSRALVTRNLPHETEASPEAWWVWLDGARERAGQVASLIGRGQFPASLHEAEVAGCPRCDYRSACRRDENLSTRRRAAMQGDANVFLPPPLVLAEEEEGV